MNMHRILTLAALTGVIAAAVTARGGEAEDAAARLPTVKLRPGAQYAHSIRMFQGIPSLEHSPRGRL